MEQSQPSKILNIEMEYSQILKNKQLHRVDPAYDQYNANRANRNILKSPGIFNGLLFFRGLQVFIRQTITVINCPH